MVIVGLASRFAKNRPSEVSIALSVPLSSVNQMTASSGFTPTVAGAGPPFRDKNRRGLPRPSRAFCERACPELAEGAGNLISYPAFLFSESHWKYFLDAAALSRDGRRR